MKLTHRLTIATALSATLATALIAGPAMAATSDDNQPTGPGTANGDKSTSCRANWTAAAILDTDILTRHPELVNPADITLNSDGTVNKIATGSNNGYTSKISTNFNTETYKAPGMFEATTGSPVPCRTGASPWPRRTSWPPARRSPSTCPTT